MERLDWLSIKDNISQINCAYYALISLLTWTTKELTDDERTGVFVINSHIFDLLKSISNGIDEFHKTHNSADT